MPGNDKNTKVLLHFGSATNSGNGLFGSFYASSSGGLFTTFISTFVDGTINFNPSEVTIGINRCGQSTLFAARWVGFVYASFSEFYTFYTFQDDGTRLYVNNVLVIDSWVDQGPSERFGAIFLTAGTWYPIVLEYYNNGGGGVITLSYSSASEAKKIIPASNLSSQTLNATSLIDSNIGGSPHVWTPSGNALVDPGSPPPPVCLLHCEGINGGTVFFDHALPPNTVTAHGVAQTSTAQSKFGSSSASFLGAAGSYLSIPDRPGFTPSGDFTIDFWIRPTSFAAQVTVICKGDNTNTPYNLVITAGSGVLGAAFGHSTGNDIGSGTFGAVTLNAWNHIALVRFGKIFKAYLNGIGTLVATSTATLSNNGGDLFISGETSHGSQNISGFVDEFRFSTVARWTANFTPPNAPYFVPKFGPALVCDGLNSFISTPPSTDFAFGTSDFTVDCWFLMDAGTNDGQAYMIAGQYNAPTNNRAWYIQRDVNNNITAQVRLVVGGPTFGNATVYTSTSNPGWHHVALVRQGTTFYLFIDGILASTAIGAGAVNASPGPLVVGRWGNDGQFWQGAIDEFRISNVARWTSNFTPPNAPYSIDPVTAVSAFPPAQPKSLAKVIPSYLYLQYNDDDDLQAFVRAYNEMAQGYIDFFNTINLPIYSQQSGPLLDWVAQGLYGMVRPTLSSGRGRMLGPFNTYALNTIAFNAEKAIGPQNIALTSDDAFQRIMTWNFHKGDGKICNIRWLKRRIMRFLTGTAGVSPNIDSTYQISVSFTGTQVNIGITVGGTITQAMATLLQLAINSGAVQMPFQFTSVVTLS